MRKLVKPRHTHLCMVGAAALALTRPFVSLAQDAAPPVSDPSPPSEEVAVVQKSGDAPSNLTIPAATEPAPPNLGGKDPALNEQEAAGVQITNQWLAKSSQVMSPTPGPDGSAQFPYGECLPQVVCAPLQMTDIQLGDGETLDASKDIHVGDPKRWAVEGSYSGEGEAQTPHLYVTPTQFGIFTTLNVTTNKRSYRILLVSARSAFMAYVSFTYKDAAPAKVMPVSAPAKEPEPPKQRDDAGEARVVQAVAAERPTPSKRKAKVLLMAEGKGTPVWTAREDDGYRIIGNVPWRPIRVYTEDGRTFIEMPKGIGHLEAPVLYLLRKAGWFHTNKDVVDFRIHGRWYIVDVVIDRALLVVGVGSSAQSVKIVRTSKGGEL